ncbi:MAG: CocE/NonD family hydrolase [Hymenobacter sp.]
MLHYKRADGVALTANLYLPPNYQKSDGPLPTLMEAYPVEFKDKANAGQVQGSPNTFTRLGWGSPVFWVTQGYAVLAKRHRARSWARAPPSPTTPTPSSW